MAQQSVLNNKGLHSSPNPHSAAPPGSLVRTINTVIRYKDVLEPRRGFPWFEHETDTPTTFGGSSDRSNEGVFFNGGLVIQYAANKLARVVTGTGATDYSGTYTPVDADLLRMKFVEIAQNLYLNTNVGVRVLESLLSTPGNAGAPIARDLDAVLLAQAPWFSVDYSTTGFMLPDTAVAYRYVWGVKDSHGNVKLGAPSGRVVVRNRIPVPAGDVVRATNVVTVTVFPTQATTGDVVALINHDATFGAGPFTLASGSTTSFTYPETATDATSGQVYCYGFQNGYVTLNVPIPAGVTTSHFLQVYRTEQTEHGTDEPSEDFYLVNETFPASADISAGFLVVSDRTPDSQLADPLYTNPNDGDGADAAKYPPPVGSDMCLWDGRLWCFNTFDKHRFNLRVVGVGSPDGIQNNDTLTIAGTTLTAKTGSTSLPTQFLVTTGDLPAQNIEYTARSLIACINANSVALGLVAYYASGVEDPPGEILLEEIGIGGAGYTVYASRPASWGPALTNSSSGAQTSENDSRPHAASYSENGEPEAFPLTNWLPIAPKGFKVLRGKPFRDKLFVFAENRKVYTVSGPAPYRVDELDGTAQLIAPDSVVVHNNQVMAFTDQGVGILTDSGMRLVSVDLEDQLLDVLALDPAVVRKLSFGYSYEEDRLYTVWVPTNNTDTACQLAFVYNSVLSVWTAWDGSRTWGNVSPYDTKLYLGDGDKNRLRVERKTLDRTDYADESLLLNISAVNSSIEVVLVDATGVAVGDLLLQSDSQRSLILEVDGNTLTLTPPAEDFVVTTTNVLKAFTSSGKYQPAAPGGPCVMKNFRDCTFHFGDFVCQEMDVTFDSETYAAEAISKLKPYAGYGTGGFGEGPFGNPSVLRNRRVEVPANHNQAAMLRVGFSVHEAYALWRIHGYTLNYEGGGDGGRP